MKNFRHLTGVSTLKITPECCIGCGACEIVCPHGVLALVDKKARIIDCDGCMECGACTMNCPTSAVSVQPGVGCASYIIQSWIRGKEMAVCDSGRCC